MSLLISACARARDCRDTCVIMSLLKVSNLCYCLTASRLFPHSALAGNIVRLHNWSTDEVWGDATGPRAGQGRAEHKSGRLASPVGRGRAPPCPLHCTEIHGKDT